MLVHASIVTCILLFVGPVLVSTQTNPRMIPAVLGSSVTLDCTVPKTANSFLIWEKTHPTKATIAINDKLQNGFQNSNKVSVHLRPDNTTSLELTSLSLMEDGEYRCYDVIDLLKMDRFDVSILVRPFDIGMSSLIGQIDEGTTQTITCTADGGKPTPSIDWYLLGPDVNRTRLTASEDVQQYPNGTWYKRSSLTFTVTRQMYQGTLFCLVNTGPISFYNESFQAHLDVNLSPLMPTIQYFTGLFNNGERSTITCTSAGSKPAATIDWYLDGAKLKNTIHEVLPRSDGTFFVTGIISVTFDKSMSGRQMRCAASNSVVRNNGVGEVNRSVTLLVTYAPEITSENGTREVTEDSDVVLTCQIDARPMPIPQNIFWRHNNNIISTGTGSRFNYTASRVADLRISSVKREDAGDYVCQALNTIGVGTGQNLHIDVSYRPFCALGGVVKHAVKRGASVTVTCTVDGNPGNSTIKWRYKGTGITINPTVATHSVYGRPRETASTAVISVVNDWQYTDVECVGTNAIGVSMSPCLYRLVRPSPPEVPTNCTWSQLNDAEIRVQCNPGFDGGSDQYFVLQQSESGGQNEITLNDTEATFLVSNLQSGTRYSFKICAASDLYPQLLSCSSEIAAQTSIGNNNQQALASAGSPESAPYIAAGVMGAVVLFILLGLIIFFIRRRRQVRKPYDHDSQLAASAAHRMYREQVINNDGHDNYGVTITSTTHGHYSTSSHSLPNRRELHNSIYGHDPTKTIRKSPPEETEESSWNQNNLPETSQSKQGGVSHVTSGAEESDVTKNTNTAQNSYEEHSNNRFIVANQNEAFVMHINPNDIKNFDRDLDNSIPNKMQTYNVSAPQTQEQSLVGDNVQVQTKNEDTIDINDFENWLNGTPSNFGKSSRHNLCYSEADISMAAMNPRSASRIDDKKSVSLEIIPLTNDPTTNNTGSMFQTTLSSRFITMDNCVEQNESSESSSASFDPKREGHETIAQDRMRRDTDINPDEDNSRLSDYDKPTFKRSSYKLAMHNNDDYTLNDFFSASVEALAALDATLADDTSLDTGHNSDTSDSFKSSSDNMSQHVVQKDHEGLSKDNGAPITDQVEWCPNLHGDKESDYVEMTSLQGNLDEKTSNPGGEPVCIEAPSTPEQENYFERTLSPCKQEHDETAALPDDRRQVEPTQIPLEQDYIDMTAAPSKQCISYTNAMHDKQGRDESNNLPSKQVEKIRLRCKHVDAEANTIPHDVDSDTSSSSNSSVSSSSECDSEEFSTPQESAGPDSIVEVSSDQKPVIGDITQDIAFIDTDSDAEVKTNGKRRTSPVYF